MKLKKITSIAKKIDLKSEDLYLYGPYKAKIISKLHEKKNKGKLILVTAITPTKAGEGKTTTAISLADSLNYLGKKTILCLREPSLGPYFGLKGGATGGGKVNVEPEEDINLHFNGDFDAITSAVNLIAACLDNSLFQNNNLNLDPNRIVYKRCIDMNDRSLREITIGQGKISKKTGKPLNGIERKDGFVITSAHELMAIFCLAKDAEDFKKRVDNILIGYTYDNKEVFVKDLEISNAIYKLVKLALYPNLVQTSFNNPCLIHGGPFANIAHGCNSLIALKTALNNADYVVTEAGFGADLGAEKFFDILCQEGELTPSLAVLVVTIRALKLHGGQKYEDLNKEDLESLKAGLPNMLRHLENINKFGVDCVININEFETDSPKEIEFLENFLKENNIKYALNTAFKDGVKGSFDIGKKVLNALDNNLTNFHPLYNKNEEVKTKIERICKEIYRAKNVYYSEQALKTLEEIKNNHHENFYICMAKTPNSFSDDPTLLNAPNDFTINISKIEISCGAKFIIPLTGSVMLMPGLPKVPNAVKMSE